MGPSVTLGFVAALAFLAGYAAGGLAGGIVTRLPADAPILGAPICTHCGQPVTSTARWLVWASRCSTCGTRLEWSFHVVRWLGAALAAGSFLRYGTSVQALAVALFSLWLLPILWIDWRRHEIYPVTLVPAGALALLLAAFDSLGAVVRALAGGALATALFGLFFVIGLVLYRHAALGAGDIFLAGLIGLFVGVHWVMPALILGMALAAISGLGQLALRIRSRHDFLPYGSYLCIGAMIALFLWGPAT